MSFQEDLLWARTGRRRWERDTDEAESFYTTLARRFQGTGRTFFAMTAHVSFSVPRVQESAELTDVQVTQALQKAWLQIRYDHPTIASWVYFHEEKKRCRKSYETPNNPDEMQAWLDETFRIVCTSQSSQEWCNSDPPVPKLPTLFFLKHPNSHLYDLVLRAEHDIIDGVGSLHLLNNIFIHASAAFDSPGDFGAPQFGDEWRNLSPPFRIAAGIPSSPSTMQKDRLDRMIKQNSLLRTGNEIATVPFKSGPTIPGRHQRVSLKLNRDSTQKVLDSCKTIRASVTHVYHAALALVLRDVQQRPEARKVRYINYALINERGNCQHPYKTSAHAVSVYHSVSGQNLVIDMIVAASSNNKDKRREFHQVVDQVKGYYQAIRDDNEHVNLAPFYWALSTPPYPPGPEAPEIPLPNEAPSASISSLGIIDNIIVPTHGSFELDDPWVTGEELGTGLGLFLGTFRGSMCLSVAYNDAWHTEQEAMDFIDRCNALVMACLRV
ncbi:hypothetical protein N7492_005780 [Penicillium capsulatum]|uniref:Uncharacterized protein n=1 Tax=Penicillium capsulatum TaxID=69766 RepID=A0A9W9LRG4_9EURO|nr:hypothetical protein N7492_005780 [Penicillium capsulatum]KAJ6135120.1 hypothetical protein N7512_000280 [Penicillium capsulatum]